MVVKLNEYQQERFVASIMKTMFNTVVGKKIAIFGFSFKANTGDTRESPAKFIVRNLLEEKAIISISDPQALENAQMDLAGIEGVITFEMDPYRATDGASAIVLLTEWNSFKSLDYEAIYKRMKKPALIFDGRNILDHQKLYALGFNVYPIGKPSLTYLK
jgi:UDPglucose 6-dehydrogenase